MGNRGVALLIFKHGAKFGLGEQRHVPAALTPGKRSGTNFTGDWVGSRIGLGTD